MRRILLCLVFASASALAQDWPSKPVHYGTPGSGSTMHFAGDD